MRATKAYIASLGTTGVLLGASILMLAVVSAVVAFNNWPSGRVPTRVQTLVIADSSPSIRIPGAAGASAAARAAALAALRGPARGTIPGLGRHDAQRVAGERIAGGQKTQGTPPKVKIPVDTPVGLPQLPDPSPLTTGDAQSLAKSVADGAQLTTGQAGISVGKISPQAGDAVSSTGATAADAVRNAPLPGPLFP